MTDIPAKNQTICGIEGCNSEIANLTNHHPEEVCLGESCCIHNPSDHHMTEWPLNWRPDTGVMERICQHGVGHPDPDHLDYVYTLDSESARAQSVHGCDGCCEETDNG